MRLSTHHLHVYTTRTALDINLEDPGKAVDRMPSAAGIAVEKRTDRCALMPG